MSLYICHSQLLIFVIQLDICCSSFFNFSKLYRINSRHSQPLWLYRRVTVWPSPVRCLILSMAAVRLGWDSLQRKHWRECGYSWITTKSPLLKRKFNISERHLQQHSNFESTECAFGRDCYVLLCQRATLSQNIRGPQQKALRAQTLVIQRHQRRSPKTTVHW